MTLVQNSSKNRETDTDANSSSIESSQGEQIVEEWLSDWAALDPAELHSFAAEHEQCHDIIEAIYIVLDHRTKHNHLLEPVCTQLFSFYRSRESCLQNFTLQFIPTLVYIYLNAVVSNEKQQHKCVETLLIGLYNLEVMDENGKPKVFSFRLPSLAQASIYHEPMTLGPAFLLESSLRRWEECDSKLVNWGPLPQVEALNAQNRTKVMTALLFVFNRHLSLLPPSALRQLCIVTSRLVTRGFHNLSSRSVPLMSQEHKPPPPRIPVSSQLLLELVHGAYFAMFNEFYTLALEAVNDVSARASYEGYADVLLVTGAVQNSLQANPSGQPCDGPMGISVALSPATNTVTVSKSMITNASFRTKKLPDDIPIQAGVSNAAETSADGLNSITEETETEISANQRNTSFRNSKSKLPSFPGLGKKAKDKEKDVKDKMSTNKANTNSTEPSRKLQHSPKDMIKTLSKGSLIPTANGDSNDFPSPLLQKKMGSELDSTSNVITEEKVSLISNSLQNSGDNSDTHSEMTTDSIELENTTSRLATMQVSSV